MSFSKFVLIVVCFAAYSVPGFTAEPAQSSKWEKEIRAFEESDRLNPPPQGALLFVGSSSIRFWTNLAESFPNHAVINRGFGGSQIKDSTAFAERIILPYRPKMILLYAGDNDLAAGLSPEEVQEDFQQFVKKIHAARPNTPIAFIAIKPSIARVALLDQARRANELVEAFCESKPELHFIDIFHPMLGEDGKLNPDLFIADKLHINRRGYELWTSLIRPFLPD